MFRYPLITFLALMVSAPTWAQQSDSRESQFRREEDRENRQRQQRDRQRQQRDRQRQDREAQTRSRGSQSEHQQAKKHFQAGIAMGYMLGYADGMDDYVIVVGSQKGRSDSRDGASSGSSSKGQEFRDNMRQRARARMSERQDGKQMTRSKFQQKDWQDAELERKRSQQGKAQQLSGEIRSIKRVRLANDNQRHMLLLVNTDEGQRRILDAGPIQQLQDLSLQEGDTVTAKGRYMKTKDGVAVFNARRIESQGQSVAIRGSASQNQSRR